MNKNRDLNSIKLLSGHSCFKSSHDSLDTRIMREVFKIESKKNPDVPPRVLYDRVNRQ